MADAEPPRRRPRISLLSLLLFTALVGTSITTRMLWSEVGPLRAEVGRLRDETGQLTIEDPNLAYAIRIPTEPRASKKYRVYLPPGREYVVCHQVHAIPPRGAPEAVRDRREIDPGEWVVTVEIDQRKDPETGEPTPYADASFRIEPASGSGGSRSVKILIGERDNQWIDEEVGLSYSSSGLGRTCESFDPNEPLVVFRARATEREIITRRADGTSAGWSTSSAEGECDGFMIWVEPIPTPPPSR